MFLLTRIQESSETKPSGCVCPCKQLLANVKQILFDDKKQYEWMCEMYTDGSQQCEQDVTQNNNCPVLNTMSTCQSACGPQLQNFHSVKSTENPINELCGQEKILKNNCPCPKTLSTSQLMYGQQSQSRLLAKCSGNPTVENGGRVNFSKVQDIKKEFMVKDEKECENNIFSVKEK